MKAIVIRDIGTGPELADVTVDPPQHGEVMVKMVASGICGTDLHVTHGLGTFPTVMGHEGSGVVVEVGAGVDSVAVGDRVVVSSTSPCGRCPACRRHTTYQCASAQRGPFGARLRLDGEPIKPFADIGSMAEYTVAAAGQLIRVPDDVPLDVMALTACGVLTGTGAVFNATDVSVGDTVLVVGCGGVGLNVVQAARLAGASTIVAADPKPARRALAVEFGADATIDPTDASIRDEVWKVVPGGVDYAFEVVGSVELVAEAMMATRPGGTCTMLGVPDSGTIPVPAAALLPGERRLQGCNMGSSAPHIDIPRLIDFYRAGRLKLDELVGRRLPLDQFREGFADAAAGSVARCLLTFD